MYEGHQMERGTILDAAKCNTGQNEEPGKMMMKNGPLEQIDGELKT